MGLRISTWSVYSRFYLIVVLEIAEGKNKDFVILREVTIVSDFRYEVIAFEGHCLKNNPQTQHIVHRSIHPAPGMLLRPIPQGVSLSL